MQQEIRRFIADVEHLPTVSPVAMQLIQLTSKPDVGLGELAHLIESDQSLASRILRIANSAAYGFDRTVNTIERATTLLGLNLVRSTALSVIVIEAFGDNGEDALDLTEFWRHSAACAAASEVLARRVRYPDAKEAFIAGLLHDIGKLILLKWNPVRYGEILRRAEQRHIPLLDAEEEDLGIGHPWVAKQLMENWRFPRALSEAAWLHHQPRAQFGVDGERRLPFILQCADTLCHHFRFGNSGNPAPQADLMAVSDGLGLSAGEIDELSSHVLEQYDQLARQFEWDRDSTHLCLRSITHANRELARMYEEIDASNRRLKRQEALLRFHTRLEAGLRPPICPEDAARVLMDLVPEAVPGRCLGLFVADPLGDGLHGGVAEEAHASLCRLDIELCASETPFAERTTRSQVAAIFAGLRQSVDQGRLSSDYLKLLETSDLIIAPMSAGGRRLGQLIVELPASTPQREEWEDLIRQIAVTAASHLEKIVLFYELDRQAESMARMARQAENVRSRLFHTERLASVGRLAAGAAHEINNPLTIISAQAQLMTQDEADEARRKGLETIVRQSDRIAKIVRDLMGLARPANPDVQATQLAEVIERTLADVTERAHSAGVEIKLDVEPGLPSTAADPKQLEQVFLNLSINAIQSMERGGILRVRLCSDAPSKRLKVVFADTGHGISDDNLNAIFDPFFSTKAEGEGMGLGLAMSRSIVQAHEGDVEVHSTVGVGSEFTVTLPIRTLPARPNTPESVSPSLHTPTADRRLLIIDNETALTRVLQETLSRDGYQVEACLDGKEALEALDDKDFHLLLVDLRLPKMDGLDVIRRARSSRPDLPFIVFSGGAEEEVFQEAQREGAAACLRKPFETAVLRDTVNRVLAAQAVTA